MSGGNDNSAVSRLSGGNRHGQSAVDRLDATVQGKLSQKQIPGQGPAGNDSRGRENPNGHGQIESGAFLFNIGRRQIDGNPIRRKPVPGIGDGGLYPFTALFHGGLGKTDGSKARQSLGNVHLHFNPVSVDTQNGAAQHPGQHRIPPNIK